MLRRVQWQLLNPIAPWLLAALVLWLCWQVASVIWLITAPPQPPLVRDVALQSQPSRVPNLSAVQLFKIERPDLSTASSAATLNVPMRLQGVMLSQPASGSSAMILMSGVADHYRIGQTLTDTQLEVIGVSWDQVQLRRPDGTVVTLKFGDDNPTSNPPNTVPNTPAAAASNAGERIDSALSDAQSQLSSNPASYLTRMGLAATGQGYEVTAGAPANIRNQMGLRPGDRIVSVNGQALGQPQNDARLLEQIRQTRSAQIEIQRGEQTLTIQQSF